MRQGTPIGDDFRSGEGESPGAEENGSTEGSVEELRRLLDEFRVQRIELEKQNEELRKLKEGEKRFEKILQTAMDGFWLVDGQGRLMRVNDAYCRMSGYSERELLTMSVPEIEIFKTPEEIAARMEKIITEGPQRFESRHRRKDGSVFDVEICVQKRPEKPGETFGFLRDVTGLKRAEEERRKLEERLLRAEKMEALGTLAGGVAHDLNNVLGIIVGYSELLAEDLEEFASIRSNALKIMKAGERAAAIVDDLLTLARRSVPGRKVLNLNSIVAECLKSPEFERILSYHRNVEVRVDLEADLLTISGSSVHLLKSLLNLVSNAVEAMPRGGSLTMRTANRYLDKPVYGYDEVRAGDYVVLTVEDEGEGIPEAERRRIFEPFYTKKVMGRSGTGLGLAVVWGAVKDHLGYIDVESREGEGTVFTIYFPVERGEISPERVRGALSRFMGNGESILVVDDVKEQRELARAMLEKLEYSVVCVRSGEEAVKYAREHAVDLMVLDMIMDPGMDGLDTYGKVIEIHPGQKAIIVSGFAETERVEQARALGVGAYVKKPYVLEKLGPAVRETLNRPA